jgi:hypothetical protein
VHQGPQAGSLCRRDNPDDMMTDGDDLKFEDIDTDGDGCISEEEFKKAKNGN